jgi:uncharacterized protein (TIGR00290 family)
MEQVVVSWSGGKESAMSLWKVLRGGELHPAGLLTVITEGYDRVSMHGVRRELVEGQASALGLKLHEVFIPKDCSNEDYEARMAEAVGRLHKDRISGFVFGDVFLEEVRRYREEKLLRGGLRGYFPLWGEKTNKLVRDFIKLGFRAIVVCVNASALDKSFVGREVDEGFLNDLPSSADPAGENGEYHCFVWDGPIFKRPVRVSVGEVVHRENFYYCDLLPASE